MTPNRLAIKTCLIAVACLSPTLWNEPLCAQVAGQQVAAEDYDPLKVRGVELETLLLSCHDAKRQRDIPLKVYLPGDKQAAPMILFSHGLGGSREGSKFLGEHWSARGYLCVFVQHPGSDESVWRNVPVAGRPGALRRAADADNFLLRVQDIPAILDQLEIWNADAGHALYQRLDLERIGMAGHSFGAVTTQAVSGQSFMGSARYTDARIKAALPLSPSVPVGGRADAAFRSVTIPWMLMTGTHDDSPIGNATPESRRGVYPALPAGNKYELVLDQAEHSVFTDRRLVNDRLRRNPQHHRSILAISTAFWDTFLRSDSAARQWLDGDGPRSVLDQADLWQHK
ncbi:MAG TPA: dienelactone hydrolase [Pirellulaceae bacterium]|nr:dienelactone hydrolase [Pirellulaceae bacterium]